MRLIFQLVVTILPFFYLSQAQAETYAFETEQPVHVIGDIHGAYQEFYLTLRQLKLIDTQGNWTGEKQWLVSLGDMLDRGPDSRKVMDLLIKLQTQAKKVGGRVHVVLGNHEVMNLKGDLRYLSAEDYAAYEKEESSRMRKEAYEHFLKAYGVRDSKSILEQFQKAYPRGFFAHSKAFDADGPYGRWLLSLPFVIKINDQIFAHGGLSRHTLDFSLDELNEQLKNSLERYLNYWQKITMKSKSIFHPPYKQRFEIAEKFNREWLNKQFLKTRSSLLFSSFSPTWYRGNMLCHPHFESDQLAKILANYKAKRLWVGHTTSSTLKPQTRLDGQLVLMDTGMLGSYYEGEPFAATINAEGDYLIINGLNGELVNPQLAPNREYANPFNLTDSQTEAFLEGAEVLSPIPELDDKQDKVTLKIRNQEQVIEVDFFYKDEYPGAEVNAWDTEKNNASRFQYELAAYRLDRLLKIGLVPVTVPRKIGGKDGVLQVKIENPLSESELMEKYGGKLGYCEISQQQNLKDTFDYLIQNTIGRRADSIYSRADGQIWFLGHSKSFNTSTKFGSNSRPDEIFVTASFKRALLNLKKSDLAGLEQWLHSEQIEGIWERRERLLDR